jgi:hypothetical protein
LRIAALFDGQFSRDLARNPAFGAIMARSMPASNVAEKIVLVNGTIELRYNVITKGGGKLDFRP